MLSGDVRAFLPYDKKREDLKDVVGDAQLTKQLLLSLL